jgi:hypothetical protein
VNARPFADHNTADVSSCLVYGNLHHTMTAQHIGHSSDVQRAANEDCKHRDRADVSLQSTDVPWFVVDGRTFVASDMKNPEGTLFRLVYQVGIQQKSSETYSMLLDYWAAPSSSENFKGIIDAITIIPSNKDVRTRLAGAGYSDGIVRLSKEREGHIEIPMPLPKDFVLQDQRFVFFDGNSNQTAEISAPFLAAKGP